MKLRGARTTDKMGRAGAAAVDVVPAAECTGAAAPPRVGGAAARRAGWWPTSRSGRVGLGALLVVLAMVLPLFRQVGEPSWATIWAEDGTVCFQDAYLEGGLRVLMRPIAGYLVLPPRLLGVVASLLPFGYLPVFFALAGTTIAALLAWLTYAASADWVASRSVRVALASQVVLMPALGQENTANTVNVIWVFAAVVPWALISLRERPRDVMGRSCVAFLAATSTALSVIFLPLAVGAAWLRATRAMWVVVTAFVVGLALQSAVVFNQTVWPHSAPSRLATLGYLIAVRVCAMFLIGPDGIAALWADHSHLLVFAAPTVVLLIFILLFPGAGRRSQAIAVVFLAYALISFLFTALGRGTDFVAWAPGRSIHPDAALPYNFTHTRFSVIPVMMLLSAAAVLIAPTDRGFYRSAAWIARPLFLVYIVAVTASGFFVTNGRSAGPSWSKATALAYAGQCFGAPPEKIVEVRTYAGDFFNVRMACRDVLQARTSGPTSW